MVITHIKNPWAAVNLCWLIRIGRFRSTLAVRAVAKNVTFAMAYGSRTFELSKMDFADVERKILGGKHT